MPRDLLALSWRQNSKRDNSQVRYPESCASAQNPRRKEVSRKMAEVIIQDGETLESALRRFKRKVQQEDIIKEIKKHSYYMKPGEKKRVKQALARKRNRKKRPKDMD